MARRQISICGNIGYIKITQGKKQLPGKKRGKKQKITTCSVKEYNRRISQKNLSMLLHHNFRPGDMHITLTYRDNRKPQEARKELKNFLDRLRRAHRKEGKLLKWIVVTEYKNQRLHHHLIVNQGLTLQRIREVWGQGIVWCSVLDESGDYRELANYLIKETEKTFRMPGTVQRQRYSCSRTVQKPPIKEEEVSSALLLRDPKPPKGYYIDQDSIVWGQHPETGNLYLEYVIVSLSAKPRLSLWPKGKRVSAFAGEQWLREERQEQLRMKDIGSVETMKAQESHEPAEEQRAIL